MLEGMGQRLFNISRLVVWFGFLKIILLFVFYHENSSCLLGLPRVISPSRLIPLLIGASSSLCIQVLFF